MDQIISEIIRFTGAAEDRLFPTTYGRTALLLALKSVPVRGREVILPAFTCPIAVLGAVIESGGIPVFVDINLKNLNFDLNDLRRKITKSTAAIISHHYFGMANPEVAINGHMARKHGLIHIEDCTHSLGAQFQDCPVGKIGDLAVYSFSKNMISPQGGLLQCNSDGLIEKVHTLYNQNSTGRITGLLANLEFLTFFCRLLIVRKLFQSVNTRFKPNSLPYRVPPLLYMPFRLADIFLKTQHSSGRFYYVSKENVLKDPSTVVIRMTDFQKHIIRSRIGLLHQMNAKRRDIAERLNEIVPPFFLQEKAQRSVYTNYVFCTYDKARVLSLAKKASILFTETWPARGKYWKEQNTKNVERLKREVLLLGISPYWSEKEIREVENFFYKNKDLFFNPPG
ncbi:MAG: DegT/DnrJ/EryC1/StrS family aminotransferase [Syntrophobacterales bacterium]|nr:DegT/DnrJ/EryC1/StrS family aminotransferase [Syntrophobacterales bacterium]